MGHKQKNDLKLAGKERLGYYCECKEKIEEEKSGNWMDVMRDSFVFCRKNRKKFRFIRCLACRLSKGLERALLSSGRLMCYSE